MYLFGQPGIEAADRKLAQFELDKCRSFPLSTLVDFKQTQLPKSADTFVRGVLACGGHSAATRPPFVIPQEGILIDVMEDQGIAGTWWPCDSGDRTDRRIHTRELRQRGGSVWPGWTEWHECPSGQLMTGVRVYRYEDKWFTGMSAICKILQRSAPPRKPIKDAVGF